MTPIQHGLLRHALGLDKRKNPFQNLFATAEGEDTFADVSKLVEAGFMTAGSKIPGSVLAGLRYYHATEAGIAAAKLDYAEFRSIFDLLHPIADAVIRATVTRTQVAPTEPPPFKAGPPPNAGPAWDGVHQTPAKAVPDAAPPWEE